ncbi:DUF4240 domain-containing protein [Actinosynnema sp. NPDC059797]
MVGGIDAADFWAVIGANPMRDADDVERALGEVSRRLDAVAPALLVGFQSRLCEFLHRIDREEFAGVPVGLVGGLELPQTSDHFLYARCACVLAGEVEYVGVASSGAGFERFVPPFRQGAEGLLYLAPEKFTGKTGADMDVEGFLPVDSMSNPSGWRG